MRQEKNPKTEGLFQDKDAESAGLTFNYEIGFDPRREALLVKVLQGEKAITRFERFGIHVLSLQDRYLSGSPLDPTHRHFIQHLLRFGNLDSWENYYVIPRRHGAYFLNRLVKFETVKSLHSKKPIHFAKSALKPRLELVGSRWDRFQVKVHFLEEAGGDGLPNPQTVVFYGSKPWAFAQGVFYSILSSSVNPLLEEFDREGLWTPRGERAMEFIEQDLPLLMDRGEIQLPANLSIPEVVRSKAKARYELLEDPKSDRLQLILHFVYGEHAMPPFEEESDCLVHIHNGEQNLLLCRDLPFEKETLDKFYSQGFSRVGPDRFETGGESALDFVADRLPSLHEEGEVVGEEHLKQFRVLSRFGRRQLKAVARSPGMDWFSLDLKFVVEDQEIPFELVRRLVGEGRRYLPLPGRGFVRLESQEIEELAQTFSELEAKEEDGCLQFKSFHAPYLEEILNIDWRDQGEFRETLRSLRDFSGIPSQEIPPALKEVVRPYQHHGYDWLRFLHEHHFHGILADDMGLGKTLQALAFLQDLKNRKGTLPNLILAPTSVVFNWESEARKFTPDLKVLQLTGAERRENYDRINEADLVLTSYAIYRRDAEFLKKISWRTVILDEAQYIKNYRSKTAGLVKELNSEQRLALTGTPLENRLSELWSIFDFLMPGFLGKFLSFQRRYQRPIEEEQDADALERLKKRLHPFVLRRQKDEVAPELPPKTEIDQFCEMNPEQRKLYEQILLACRKTVFEEVEVRGIERSQFSILTALLRLRQICCHPRLIGKVLKDKEIESGKFEMFQELLEEILSERHRVIVFSQFVEMLGLLKGWLEEKKIPFEYLDGRTRKREERIRNFQTNPDIPVFLISLKAGGTGLNLSEADYVIHYDPWWNPAVQDQATDRVHRLGQKQHVFAYKLITKESVEEKILKLQERKRDLFKGVLTADSKLGKKLSYEDLEYLFS